MFSESYADAIINEILDICIEKFGWNNYVVLFILVALSIISMIIS